MADRWRRLDAVTHFVGKLVSTRAGNKVAVGVLTAAGLLAGFLIHDSRVGTDVFLLVTALESGVFSLVFAIASSWRKSEAASAVFWTVLAYSLIAWHIITTSWLGWRYWWTQDLRQLLYLGLSVAGLNLVLTMMRLLRQ